jgi:beta-galactosidase
MQNGKVIDKVSTNFGFRTIEWKKETGFWLNNENIKLKGVCEHLEGGPVGGAWTKPMLRWKLQLLKDMGINAIRPSHNPFPPMFYDLCDELGLLVMDEIFDGWHKKAAHDYGAQAFDEWWQTDVREWITRDRNHPSVFIWSLGNETHSDIAPEMVKFCNMLDPTRLVTSGSGNTDDMQVAGVNGGSEYKSFIENKRFDKAFVSTEAPHTWQTRGYYRTQTWFRDGLLKNTYPLPDLTEKEIFFFEWTDPKNWKNRKQHFNSSYDNATVRISARKNWEVMRDTPWHSGHFRWTGFDYYGESGLAHGAWPFNLFMGGVIDVAGFEKDHYYFYQSQWTEEPMVHILPHWTHPRMEKGTIIPVWVYSNAEEVELYLNGVSLGKDRPGKVWNEMQCEWMVPWEEGELVAIAYNKGIEVKRIVCQTSTQPVKLKNSIQKLDAEAGFDPGFILTTEGLDKNGNLFPYAENAVYYSTGGDMEIISLENGNPVDATSRADAKFRSMFMGKTRAFLQSSGSEEDTHVLLASILGDKSLYLSNKIFIDVELIQLSGDKKQKDYEVFYTINGENPAEVGIPYQKPFEIKDGTTVRAVIKENDRVLIEMSETFGEKEGLFWGDEHSEDLWIGRGINIPAEDAILKGSAKASDDGRWFKNEGFVVFNDKEGSITWYQENDGLPGEYRLRFRYTHNDASSTRPMILTVNDEVIDTLEFKSSGSWKESWKMVERKVIFKAGANNIELRTIWQSGPNIDEMIVE